MYTLILISSETIIVNEYFKTILYIPRVVGSAKRWQHYRLSREQNITTGVYKTEVLTRDCPCLWGAKCSMIV